MMIFFNTILRKTSSFVHQLYVKRTLRSLKTYLESKGVKLLYVELPDARKIKGLNDFEKERINKWSFDFNKYKEELPKLKRLYGDDISEDYILSIFDGGVVVQGAKRKVLLDFESANQHIINGHRLTLNQPVKFKNVIYTHGACTWRGTGVEDGETIASYLQSSINEHYENSYKVVNSAIGRGSTIKDDIVSIKEQDYKEGDIIILGPFGFDVSGLDKAFWGRMGIGFLETSSVFDRPHSYGEWFNDSTLHTNKRGNIVLADRIFNKLQELGWLSKSNGECRNKKSSNDIGREQLRKGTRIYGDNPELIKYIDTLKPYYRGDNNSINGAIVMNCNPFTLGHRYLIEYASSRVDNLYIFVVEENRSYFPFEDRIELVRQGTSDIKNVIVLPSGNFIISATTFPGYFYKDDLKDVKIDCSNDITVFAEYIAPALNIRIRYAGEEPLDPITSQYNDGMTELLPKYGMEFRVIPRKKDSYGSGVISASRVRKLFEGGDIEALKQLVPPTTLDYLKKRQKIGAPND